MIVFVIANPSATAVGLRGRDDVIRTLREVSSVEVASTTGRLHATALAAAAVRDRSADLVIGLGGDGTANEIVNGLLADGVHDGVPPFGVVPAGATNVFARSLGFPNDAQTAARILRNSLHAGCYRKINIGRVEDRYFVFCAGIGLDAAIIEQTERRRARGEPSTLFSTGVATARRLFSTQWPSLQLELPGRQPIAGLRWMIVTKTDRWTFIRSRPLRPTPKASFELGMDIYARRRMRPFPLLWSAIKMLRSTPQSASKGIILEHDIGEFVVRSDEPTPVQVDGDMWGRSRKLHFRCLPNALRVVAPTSTAHRDGVA